jgi:DNA-binding transcriptional MerR regulator
MSIKKIIVAVLAAAMIIAAVTSCARQDPEKLASVKAEFAELKERFNAAQQVYNELGNYVDDDNIRMHDTIADFIRLFDGDNYKGYSNKELDEVLDGFRNMNDAAGFFAESLEITKQIIEIDNRMRELDSQLRAAGGQ